MNKRLFFILTLIILISVPSKAVLKEKDLSNTLEILRSELTNYHREQSDQQKRLKERSEKFWKDLINIGNKSNQNSLMLYSQKEDYVFDLTYACHEATEQYHEFQRNVMPIKKFIHQSDIEVARYDSLILSLSKMHVDNLSEKAKIDRNVCLTLAINIRRMLVENQQSLTEYVNLCNKTEQKLKTLNDYAEKRYGEIQNSIFKNGGDNYFVILSKINNYVSETKSSISEKYKPLIGTKSQWDGKIIISLFLIIAFYGLIAIVLNLIIVRFLATRLIKKGVFKAQASSFLKRRTCIVMASTVVTFAVILGIIRVSTEQNFLIMASDLLVEYAWLLGVVLISILLRVDSTQIMSTFRIYTPLIVIGFIVIAFRIILIPNDLVNLIFPPILLICTLWQWNVISRHSKNIDKSDVNYTYISLIVFVVSLISSWVGYTLMSVQLLIWWIMQLTCILTITCIRGWFIAYGNKKGYDSKPITKTWIYRLILGVIIPMSAVYSVLISIYWAADVFNLSDLTRHIFSMRFIDSKNFTMSIFTICMVIILWFIFRYINRTAKAIIKLIFEKKDKSTAASRSIMVINVMQVVIWGVWLIVVLSIFHVNNTWLVVISGGLSTGIGFAMKDVLENIYYGISLMAGRIKIGDWIECDGTRGKVSSISYTSTMIDTVDGSVIAFQNSQLFTKNYKNMTRNHGYELDILEVGVAYGTNIEEVKKLLVNEISKLEFVYKKKPVNIVLKAFSDSCLTLKILVWVPVLSHYGDDGKILECVYNTLNANNIEIPFPQHDIHIKHDSEETKEPLIKE